MSLLSFLPILIVLSGSYLLIKLNFFFFKHPIRTLKFAFSGKNKKKSVISLMLALAGTLGVGNISGVAIGIATGGPGSVFWLVLSALFSSSIKYSEVFLSSKFNGAGMIGVIKNSFKPYGKALSYTYAALTIILSFSMGSAFQARAIAEAGESINGINTLYLFTGLALFVAFVCISGTKKIKSAVSLTIPVATLLYTGMCILVISRNIHRLPKVLSTILSSAFSSKSIEGGVLGFIVSSGMKEGFARGLLSNEAGAGTSSFSHTSHFDLSARAQRRNKTASMHFNDNCDLQPSDNDAIRAGIFGILEVVFDTLLLCPLTALTILIGYDGNRFSGSLVDLSSVFENNLGKSAPALLLCSIIFFAVSTTLCWYYYGIISLKYIFRGTSVLYSALFFIFFMTSLLTEIPHVLFITDTALFLLSLISLSALIKNRALLTSKKRSDKNLLNFTSAEFNTHRR